MPIEFPVGLWASLLAAAVSTAGLLSMALIGDWGRRNGSYFSAFAVGVLVVAVLFHLVPEAIASKTNAAVWIGVGFAVMTAIGVGSAAIVSNRRSGPGLALGYVSIVALGFHSFMDGVIYQLSFHVEPFTGWLSTLGLLLHEFPEGVIGFFLLRNAGLSVRSSVTIAFFAASLTTILGTLTTAYFVESAMDVPLGPLLGATAGGLIYVIVAHLGPHAAQAPQRRGYAVASLGVVVGIAAVIFHHG